MHRFVGKYLKSKGDLSLSSVAKAVGVSRNYLAAWARGEKGAGRPEFVRAVAAAAGVDVEGLEYRSRLAVAVKVELEAVPERYRSLLAVLLDRIAERDLTQSAVDELMRILDER